MRAVLVAVALLALMGGVEAKAAKACRLDGATLVATSPEDEKPDLTKGDRYKVLRISSDFRKMRRDESRPGSIFGGIEAEVVGPRGTFVVDQDWLPGSSPYVSGVSRNASERSAKVNWGKRSRAFEKKLYGSGMTFDLYDGPLGRVLLVQSDCQ